MRISRGARAAGAVFLIAGAAWSANPYHIPDQVDAELKAGLQHLFNLEFAEAEARIGALQVHAEAHPMVALAPAVVEWWKISVRVMERDDEASRAFVKASERSLRLAERGLSRDKHAEARTAMGTVLGLMSRWSAANRAWLPAYTRGLKSVGHLERALKINPAAADAYMTLGTFNYARALINRRMGGKEEKGEHTAQNRGLAQLRRAYASAPYFRQAAGLLMAGILANERPAEAVPVLLELRRDLPKSAFVQVVLACALYNAGLDDEMDAETDVLFEKIEAGAYDAWFLPQAHFLRGLALLRKEKWRAAGKAFDEAREHGDESNPYTTWALLYRGYCHDALGRREKAKECYRGVLRLKPRFASHEHARERLSTPFSKDEPELKKLEL